MHRRPTHSSSFAPLLGAALAALLGAAPTLRAQEPPVATPAERAAPAAPVPNAPNAPTAPTATADSVPVPGKLAEDGTSLVEPRIRDITRPHNVMPHLLVGIGVVTGLSGTGASDRGTRQAILNLVRDNALNLSIADVVGGNTALVSLTASLPPFAKVGTPIKVKVQTIGDAASLRGGTLMRAELRGVDGQMHAVVQGEVLVGGFAAAGANASVQKNTSTTGTVPDGGYVVRDVASSYWSEAGDLELEVARPSPFNAASIAAGCRRALAGRGVRVTAIDPTLVRIQVEATDRTHENALDILNRVGSVRVPVENPAKITVDQSTGTIIVGEGVLISPCVVGLTDLTISVIDEDDVVQPNALANGETARVGRTHIEVQSNNSDLKPVAGGSTVAALVQNLKSLGLTPSQLVSVFQALDAGGFLHAELEVQ